METLPLSKKVMPLPNPPSYPPFNGKNERAHKVVQSWFQSFGPDQDWTTEDLQKELNFCFMEVDELWEREEFGGGSRRKAYAELLRASVDRDAFLQDTTAHPRALLRRPDSRLTPMQAWRVATRDMLRKFGLEILRKCKGISWPK